MAERVQLGLESMLTELEQMQRVHLLSADEIKAVIKRRKKFEYRLQKPMKKKEDILAYVQYECSLLDLVQLRRDKLGYLHKKAQIDDAIINRINRLLRVSEQRFGHDDAKLWLTHVAFLNRQGWDAEARKVLQRFLQARAHHEETWLWAARHELEVNHNVENARNVLVDGIKFHPMSRDIFREAFVLELNFVQRVLASQSKVDQQANVGAIKQGKLAEIFFQQAIEAIPDQSFVAELLALSNRYPDRQIHENLCKLAAEKGGQEDIWNTIARLELHPRPSEDRCFSKKVNNCCSIFNKALEELPTEKMLQLYVETLLDVAGREEGEEINTLLGKALKKGEKLGLVNEMLKDVK